jgi:hypothetical protein
MKLSRTRVRVANTLLLLVAATACSRASQTTTEQPVPEEKPQASFTNPRDLIIAMHDKYAEKWYRTLRFSQTNTFYTSNGQEQKSRWVENLSVPGRLRIDFEPLSSKSGLLILNNRVTTFDNGKRVDSRRSIQAILTLTADVYAIPPEITLRRLDSLRIDLSRIRMDSFDKKRAYVVGAKDENDSTSNQIWIDADRLLLLRLIQTNKLGERSITTDTRVREYKNVDGFPVAHEFMSYRAGKPYFKEEYENVRVNADLPEGVFDATRWARVNPQGE